MVLLECLLYLSVLTLNAEVQSLNKRVNLTPGSANYVGSKIVSLYPLFNKDCE